MRELMATGKVNISENSSLLVFSHRVYPPTAYTARFLQQRFSGVANRRKLITSFTQTKVVTTSLKSTRLQSFSPLVTTGLLCVNRHFQCNANRSLISELAELLSRKHS